MKKDVIYVNEGLILDECRDIMILKNIGIFFVFRDNKIIGVLK